jgi:Bacterial membrane protein N terminal
VTLCSIGVKRFSTPRTRKTASLSRTSRRDGSACGRAVAILTDVLSHDPSASRRRGNGRQAEAGSGPGSPRGLVLRSASSRFLICRPHPAFLRRQIGQPVSGGSPPQRREQPQERPGRQTLHDGSPPRGSQPTAVTHQAATLGQAVDQRRRPDDPRRYPASAGHGSSISSPTGAYRRKSTLLHLHPKSVSQRNAKILNATSKRAQKVKACTKEGAPMPSQNNNNGRGGPWGSGARPGSNFEDLVRQGQDRLKQIMPSGVRAE